MLIRALWIRVTRVEGLSSPPVFGARTCRDVLSATSPDIALLDITMPQGDGLRR
jgi:hypothetical protein